MLTNTIRNFIYPASIFIGVGSLWMMAYSSTLADRSGYLEPAPLTPKQMIERRKWEKAELPPEQSSAAPTAVADTD